MSTQRFRFARPAFTLVEMLIVVTVIATLALIVIPRTQGAIRKAREAALRTDLQELRLAISAFEADTSLYPATLADLVRPRKDAPTQGYTADGQLTTLPDPRLYQGPYLVPSGGVQGTGVPINPFVSAEVTEIDSHWSYNAERGPDGIACPAGIGTTLIGRIPLEHL